MFTMSSNRAALDENKFFPFSNASIENNEEKDFHQIKLRAPSYHIFFISCLKFEF